MTHLAVRNSFVRYDLVRFVQIFHLENSIHSDLDFIWNRNQPFLVLGSVVYNKNSLSLYRTCVPNTVIKYAEYTDIGI